jgi:spore coat protein W
VSESSKKPPIPQSIIDLLVNDLFKKNGINIEKAKNKISPEQKEMLQSLVSDLTKQVESFVTPPSPSSEKKSES